jgi:hypothetical protein
MKTETNNNSMNYIEVTDEAAVIRVIYASASGSINGLPAIPEFRFSELKTDILTLLCEKQNKIEEQQGLVSEEERQRLIEHFRLLQEEKHTKDPGFLYWVAQFVLDDRAKHASLLSEKQQEVEKAWIDGHKAEEKRHETKEAESLALINSLQTENIALIERINEVKTQLSEKQNRIEELEKQVLTPAKWISDLLKSKDKRISELEAELTAYRSLQLHKVDKKIKELEAEKKEHAKKLETALLPTNLECDGAYCMGCWKDVVRSVIKSLTSNTEQR